MPFMVSFIQTSWEILGIITLDNIKNASICAAAQEYESGVYFSVKRLDLRTCIYVLHATTRIP